MADPWWVEETNIGSGWTPQYQAVQGATKPNPSLILTASGTTVKVTGPFKTQAAAQATIPTGASTGPGGPESGAPSVNPLQSVSSVVDEIAAIWDKLKDGKMWRSLGWLLLGILLMIMGLVFWIGPSAARQSPLGLAKRALG